MIYSIKELEEFSKAFEKIEKKDPLLAERIRKKLKEIINSPERFKPLRNVLVGSRSVHFGSYVLKYKIEGSIITLVSITHHDQAY